jgi:ankyrin repeat protein
MRTIQPDELRSDAPHGPWSCRGRDIWDAFCAAADGDAATLRDVLARDPNLYRAEYWYTQPIHFAVREGELEAVRMLLEAGADPSLVALSGEDLVTLARDRGHIAVVELLEQERARRPSAPEAEPKAEHPILAAAETGDLAQVRTLVDADPRSIHAESRSGRRPLSLAAGRGHEPVVRLLIERGADPNAPEGAEAPRGMALYKAAWNGHRGLVELLLDHGADPNATIDSSGSATYAAARTPELRRMLEARGGRLDPYDLVFLDEDEEALRRVVADPAAANQGCGGVLAAACTQKKRDLVVKLLDAGARVPPVLTGCRSYLMSEPETLRLLLASGMDPDLPNWQRATPLHDLCWRDRRGRANPHRVECASILLDAGASLTARDEDYRSTPLALAARSGLADMVDLLVARGSPTSLPDDEPWARPLAWATRRGHAEIAATLRRAGAGS